MGSGDGTAGSASASEGILGVRESLGRGRMGRRRGRIGKQEKTKEEAEANMEYSRKDVILKGGVHEL